MKRNNKIFQNFRRSYYKKTQAVHSEIMDPGNNHQWWPRPHDSELYNGWIRVTTLKPTNKG